MAGEGAVIDVPPPRYRVVERDRRLEVIDTRRSGPTASRGDPRQASPRTAFLPRRTAFDGSAELTTSALYDDQAPRTIALDPASATIVRWALVGAIVAVAAYGVGVVFAPWLLAALPLVFDKRARAAWRAPVTRWLDKVEREAG